MIPVIKPTKLSAMLLAALIALLATSRGNAQPGGPDPDSPVVFSAVGDRLHMTGVIDRTTLQRLRFALAMNQGIKTIVMNNVPGSDDDDAALLVYREVRRRGLNTLVPANGIVASGGVDFFCAGVKRIAEPGSKLLVHPWEDNNLGRGSQVPLTNPVHNQYRNYYREMGVDTKFYEHTLFAPRGNVRVGNSLFPDMHEMQLADLQRFRVITGTSMAGGGTGNDPGPTDPAPPVPDEVVTLGQLVGEWTWTFKNGSGTLTLSGDSTFRFNNATTNTSGRTTLNGRILTLIAPTRNFKLTIVSVTPEKITLAASSLTRNAARPIDPPRIPFTLEGTWIEVRTDGRSPKSITINANGRFVERFGNEVWNGAIRLDGETLTLRGTDGVVETFRVRNAGNNRINFFDARNGRPIQRFHWVRR